MYAYVQTAVKKLAVSKAPAHLFLCLNRNKFERMTNVQHKILTDVQYPCVLRLPTATSPNPVPYVLYASVVHCGRYVLFVCLFVCCLSQTHVSRLFNALFLFRSVGNGHYYSIGRDTKRALDRFASHLPDELKDGGWFKFNDTSISPSSFEALSTIAKTAAYETSYALLYRRALQVDLHLGKAALCKVNVPLVSKFLTVAKRCH